VVVKCVIIISLLHTPASLFFLRFTVLRSLRQTQYPYGNNFTAKRTKKNWNINTQRGEHASRRCVRTLKYIGSETFATLYDLKKFIHVAVPLGRYCPSKQVLIRWDTSLRVLRHRCLWHFSKFRMAFWKVAAALIIQLLFLAFWDKNASNCIATYRSIIYIYIYIYIYNLSFLVCFVVLTG